MRIINEAQIAAVVKEMCVKAAHELPADTIAAFKKNLKTETNAKAKKILSLCLQNAQIAKAELLPLCQDTGTAVFFIDIGHDLRIEGNITEAVNKGVKQGYQEGYLRKSIVSDPLFTRQNTKTNLPPIIYYNFIKGDKLKISLMLKGGGAENTSRLKMFTPSADITEIENFVLETVKAAGANACPPLVVGIGIGGNFEQCAILAKKSLLRKVGVNNKNKQYAAFEKELLNKINKLGLGPQGLGGKTTALSVNIEYAPCHMAGLPVAVNLGCHSNRHITKTL